jgi:hypothetical protein
MDDTAKWIRTCLIKGEFRLSIHAGERGSQRLVSENDIRRCGKTAKSIKYQPLKKTWRVVGKDCDDEIINVICAVHEMLLIVTVY